MSKLVSTSAKTYAESLIQADSNYQIILNELNTVKQIIEQASELTQTLENPTISIQIKFEIIDEVFKNQVSEKIVNFLKILVDKKRFNELKDIITAYSDNVDELNNVKRVEVVSAVELSEEQKQRTIEKLQKRLEKNVIVSWTQNEKIIGGLVIKIDDDIIDSSLKHKLEILSKI